MKNFKPTCLMFQVSISFFSSKPRPKSFSNVNRVVQFPKQHHITADILRKTSENGDSEQFSDMYIFPCHFCEEHNLHRITSSTKRGFYTAKNLNVIKSFLLIFEPYFFPVQMNFFQERKNQEMNKVIYNFKKISPNEE